MTNTSPKTAIEKEIESRLEYGCEQLTIAQIEDRLNSLGYYLDRSMDCRCNAITMTGDRAGESYPCITVYPRELDTKKSFAHVEARRDSNFQKLQELRQNVFAVIRGAIFEL